MSERTNTSRSASRATGTPCARNGGSKPALAAAAKEWEWEDRLSPDGDHVRVHDDQDVHGFMEAVEDVAQPCLVRIRKQIDDVLERIDRTLAAARDERVNPAAGRRFAFSCCRHATRQTDT